MDTMTRVQILFEAVYKLHIANTLEKSMYQVSFSEPIGKQFDLVSFLCLMAYKPSCII